MPAIIIFLDANVTSKLKKLLEDADKRIEVIILDRQRKKAKDRELLAYFEAAARSKHQSNAGLHFFILTHDLDFEIDAGYQSGSPTSIIKLPQPTGDKTIFNLAVESLRALLKQILSSRRPLKISGIIAIN